MQYDSQPHRRHLGGDVLQIGMPLLAVAFIFLFSTLLQSAVVLLVSSFAPHLADADWYVWTVSMVPMYAVAMPLSLLLYRPSRSEPPPKRSMPFPVWLGTLSLCFALTYVGNWVGILVNTVIGILTGEPPINDLANLTAESPFWANLLFGGILAPIMEEVFYRKMMIDRLRRYGDLPAILLSGVIFGLIHGNFSQFFYATLSGIVLGYVYLKTGKLRYTVGLHMAINLVGSVYSVEMLKKLNLDLLASDPLKAFLLDFGGIAMFASYMVFAAAVLISAPFAIFFLRKYIHLRKASNPLTASQWKQVLVLNPGAWILALVIVLLFVL